MKEVALITGASSGIGKDLAHIHAEKGGDLIIVARREDALIDLKKELEESHNVEVRVIAKDLVAPDACTDLFKEISDEGITVDYLINNAGFGGQGVFHKQDSAYQQKMIDLNIKALTELSRLFMPGMVERNKGRILNVASTAGLVPGPLQAVYFATKAYVVSLSQALASEVNDTNVTVTALCPGATKTEFLENADLQDTLLVKSGLETSRSVAEKGYKAMMKGKFVEITRFSLKMTLEYAVPLLPRKMVLNTVKMSQKK